MKDGVYNAEMLQRLLGLFLLGRNVYIILELANNMFS